jgi:hypothetical protein
LQRQLWAIEHQIWDEKLCEEERERRRQTRARAAEVRREVRRQRRWAAEHRQQVLQQQLREMEAAIREEQLSDAERAWRREYREREAEIRREARRRLGLPEEETDENGVL